jgi:hypothetical protein
VPRDRGDCEQLVGAVTRREADRMTAPAGAGADFEVCRGEIEGGAAIARLGVYR